jgi:hypothetical protein
VQVGDRKSAMSDSPFKKILACEYGGLIMQKNKR